MHMSLCLICFFASYEKNDLFPPPPAYVLGLCIRNAGYLTWSVIVHCFRMKQKHGTSTLNFTVTPYTYLPILYLEVKLYSLIIKLP